MYRVCEDKSMNEILDRKVLKLLEFVQHLEEERMTRKRFYWAKEVKKAIGWPCTEGLDGVKNDAMLVAQWNTTFCGKKLIKMKLRVSFTKFYHEVKNRSCQLRKKSCGRFNFFNKTEHFYK